MWIKAILEAKSWFRVSNDFFARKRKCQLTLLLARKVSLLLRICWVRTRKNQGKHVKSTVQFPKNNLYYWLFLDHVIETKTFDCFQLWNSVSLVVEFQVWIAGCFHYWNFLIAPIFTLCNRLLRTLHLLL